MKKRWLFRLFRRRLLVAILILLQIAFFALLVTSWAKTPWISLGMWIFTAGVIVYIVKKQNKRVALLPWIVLCLVFPVFGGLFYFAFHLGASSRFIRRGIRGLTGHIERPSASNALTAAERAYPSQTRLLHYLAHAENFPVYGRTEVAYLPSGEAMLEALVQALSDARRYIFLEYFIIEEGEMWDRVHEILKAKAAEGILVRVIYDDVGCFFRLPSNFAKQLKKEGIECAVFNPFRPLLTSLQNHRDHRKIAVIDGEIAFTGGVNLADEYINAVERFGHWKDAAVCLRGEGACAFAAIFMENWCLCRGEAENVAPYLADAAFAGGKSDTFVQAYADSPLGCDSVSEAVYHSMIAAAGRTLYITTPYFIVENDMVKALINAAKSGVDVRIVTPHKWDKRLVHTATRSYYGDLIRGGVRVYEYSKGFIHSKTVVADQCVSVVGTVNFDYRSLYYHFECGTVVYGEETAADLERDFFEILSVSREMTAADCERGFIRRLFCDLLRIFSPLM